jgi:hypothetical protein
MSITALPQPPTRSDPVNFNSRADAFLSALPTFATEANELQADVNAKQTAAATSATNAAAAELAANAAANVTAWVSGTTYAVGNVRYSPITFLSYRRKTAGAGTTDPSADSTNWQLINGTGNVDLNSTQTLTNKTFGTGCTWDGNVIPVAEGGTGATTAANAFNALKQNATETATGVVELATTAEAAAGTASNVVVTPAGLRAGFNASGSAPVYACRAWVSFQGPTGSINASGNIASVTRSGTGVYTITFSTALPTEFYAVSLGAGSLTTNVNEDASINIRAMSSSSITFHVMDATSNTLVDRAMITLMFVC